MQIHTNSVLLRRKSRIAGGFLLAATVCLVGGLFVSLVQPDPIIQYAVSIASLSLGLGFWARNQAYLHRWGPRWRQDQAIGNALKGLDNRYHLLVAPAPALPDYVLVGPMGILLVAPSPVRGTVRCTSKGWRHDDPRPLAVRWLLWFSPNPSLGNPTGDLERGVRATRAYLAPRLNPEIEGGLRIEGLAVFTDPAVNLSLDGCAGQGLLLRSFRGHVSRSPRALSNSAIGTIVEVLTGR
ncbi:MAG: hypothetical protein EXR58_06500 [Chloroflexi bacterium]|nr:hypothetical protein [Chloroflexota bacterium]